jgi:hypothetical protein
MFKLPNIRYHPATPPNNFSTPERDHTAERQRSHEQRLNMTNPDDRHNRSHSHTPPVQIPQPVFLNMAEIPQVQIPADLDQPLQFVMPNIPPLPVFGNAR